MDMLLSYNLFIVIETGSGEHIPRLFVNIGVYQNIVIRNDW